MILYVSIIIGIFALLFWLLLKSRNMEIWILSYIKQFVFKKELSKNTNIKNIYFCLVDHYEPYFGSVPKNEARRLVDKWVDGYLAAAKSHSDSNGKAPQHTFFYPEEEYDETILNKITDFCNNGYGDVEIHLHHDNDTAENLEITLNKFKELLFEKHGLLRKDENGNIVYGFIHGNWALDNSRPDGRWCGIDNEIDVLIKTGCEYDMTMPSAPSDTQTTTINSIYLAKEDGKSKSHNKGRRLKLGQWKEANELLMIQGPLTLNWKSRKFNIIPRIESGELSFDAPPTEDRVNLWEGCGVSVEDVDDHIFIKLHTHGLQERNLDMFLNLNGFDTLWSALENKYKNKPGYKLHYVSAWEMYEQIKMISLSKD